MPRTRSSASSTAPGSWSAPMRQVPTGWWPVVARLRMASAISSSLSAAAPGESSGPAMPFKGRLAQHPAHVADPGHQVRQVRRVLEVLGIDQRRVQRVVGGETDAAQAARAQQVDVDLKARFGGLAAGDHRLAEAQEVLDAPTLVAELLAHRHGGEVDFQLRHLPVAESMKQERRPEGPGAGTAARQRDTERP